MVFNMVGVSSLLLTISILIATLDNKCVIVYTQAGAVGEVQCTVNWEIFVVKIFLYGLLAYEN